MVATARSLLGPELARLIDFTLPTETLLIRTSDSTASWAASSNGTLTRYPSGFNGIGPPKVDQRKSSRPKHENAKATATAICPSVGPRVLTALLPRRSWGCWPL